MPPSSRINGSGRSEIQSWSQSVDDGRLLKFAIQASGHTSKSRATKFASSALNIDIFSFAPDGHCLLFVNFCLQHIKCLLTSADELDSMAPSRLYLLFHGAIISEYKMPLKLDDC